MTNHRATRISTTSPSSSTTTCTRRHVFSGISFGYIPPTTPSPSHLLTSLIPLLQSLHPIFTQRITCPTSPCWMDERTRDSLLSIPDADLHRLERNPSTIASFLASHDPQNPLFCSLHSLSHPILQSSFPQFSTNATLHHNVTGRSKRRSKSRPRPAKRVQISRVAALLSDTLELTTQPVTRIVDVGAGHGHLSRLLATEPAFEHIPIVALEKDPDLVSTASSAANELFSIIQTDVCSKGDANSVLVQNEMTVYDAVLGLHACGYLGDSLLSKAVVGNASVILLVSCCLQKIALSSDKIRLPLSELCLSDECLRNLLTMTRAQLGATNTSRGYSTEKELRGRETRYAIRTLLKDMGKPVSRTGEEVHGVSRHALRQGLTRVLPELLELNGVTETNKWLAQGEDRTERAAREFRLMRSLALPRAFASLIFEIAVVLDRATYLEEAGYNVFHCRIWPDDISARNLAIAAWR